jgi:glycosyltransferase involved in cell wall biosynthesis
VFRAAVITDMWPSVDEPHAGRFVLASVAHGPPGWEQVVLTPRLLARRAHRRVWGRAVQGWQDGYEAPPPPHRLLRYPTFRLPKVGESAARAAGVRSVLAATRTPVDLVHGHFLLGVAPAAARVGRALRVPVVLTAHGTDVRFLEGGLPPARRDEILAACAAASTVVAVSADLARRLVQVGVEERRVEVLPMGVDADVFAPGERAAARRELGLPDAGPIVLFVGRVTPDKGVIVLSEAAHRLDRDTRVFAAGPAEVTPPGIELLGVLAPRELARWLVAADVMCLPSFAEGTPVSVAEALATGTPVVATSVGGIPDQIAPGNGLLVPPGDVDALATALSEALSRSWSPEMIRATSEPLWWSSISARLGEIYARALL